MTTSDTVDDLAAKLAKVEQQITTLQEEAARGEMYQTINAHWKSRYVDAVEALAKARTHRDELSTRLRIAQELEKARLAELERREQLQQEIDEAGEIG